MKCNKSLFGKCWFCKPNQIHIKAVSKVTAILGWNIEVIILLYEPDNFNPYPSK